MNWIDILLLVIIAAALIWGIKTGILQTVFVALGVVVGWWLAGQYADNVGDLAGSVASLDSILTVVAYSAIIGLATAAAVKLGGLIRTMLNIGTMGTVGMADRVVGLVLGGVVGLVIACAVIIVLTRLAFDFNVEVPASELVGRGPGIVSIENQRQALVDSLAESRAISYFMDVRDILPEEMLGLVPDDFDMGLDLLSRNMS